MEQTILSNIELYYVEKENVKTTNLVITGDDAYHIIKVMRHKKGDEVYVTDGRGQIYQVRISEIERNDVSGWIVKPFHYDNIYKNITICIPMLKNSDRLEFAIEKCIELGITNIMIYEAKRSVARGMKLPRWQKQAHAAMKQSLRSFLPKLEQLNSLKTLNTLKGRKIIFEQNAESIFIDKLRDGSIKTSVRMYLVFGPEGGLTDKEIESIEDREIYQLTPNRLRSETAIITAVSVLVNSLK